MNQNFAFTINNIIRQIKQTLVTGLIIRLIEILSNKRMKPQPILIPLHSNKSENNKSELIYIKGNNSKI